jgi:hypothetical protein
MDDVSQLARARIRVGTEKTGRQGQPTKSIKTVRRLSHLEHDLLIVVELVGSHSRASLQNRRHIVEPLLSLLGLVPVHRPSKIGRIDVCGEPV